VCCRAGFRAQGFEGGDVWWMWFDYRDVGMPAVVGRKQQNVCSGVCSVAPCCPVAVGAWHISCLFALLGGACSSSTRNGSVGAMV
jgi:hypothetical protein